MKIYSEDSTCRFCSFSKVAGAWVNECTNPNSEYFGGECIEKQRYGKSDCDDKEVDE